MTWPARPARKWLEAERITTMEELYHQLQYNRAVFWRGRAMATAVVRNWSLGTISGALTGGWFARAQRNPEWRPKGPTRAELTDEIISVLDSTWETEGMTITAMRIVDLLVEHKLHHGED